MSATDTYGGATSGNSSVLSRSSENSPNTTSASIVTMVTMGRRMAKSLMNTGITRRDRLAGRAYPRHRPWCESLRRAHEHGVARGEAAGDLGPLVHGIVEPDLYVHLLHPAHLEPLHDGPHTAP